MEDFFRRVGGEAIELDVLGLGLALCRADWNFQVLRARAYMLYIHQ